ncbi:MAG: diaminopimelate decarboxylase [Pseudomonadota bacterium]
MHHFHYKDGILHAEGVGLAHLAQTVGTPFYCYSEATLRRHVRVFQEAFEGADLLTAFSVKANSNISILKVLASEGAGADVVSAGELKRARLAGIDASKIVFSGVGKTRDELALGLGEGIHQFNVESENELIALNDVAISMGTTAPIAFRVNPNVAAGGHEKISTGKAEDKFGVPWSEAHRLYAKARDLPGIDVKGVDVHIGSQIASLEPFRLAFEKVADLVRNLRSDGHEISRVDLGGGLGIPYGEGDEHLPSPADYGKMIREIADPLDVQLIFEPGRMIAGNAGILVTKVIYRKQGQEGEFLIVDAAMNDLIRPALYDAFHDIQPVEERYTDDVARPMDVVGPICETGDRLAKARPLPPFEEGALVAIMSAGAYGAVQASQYNSRPLIPETLVTGSDFRIIRKRPTFEEMIALEADAPSTT